MLRCPTGSLPPTRILVILPSSWRQFGDAASHVATPPYRGSRRVVGPRFTIDRRLPVRRRQQFVRMLLRTRGEILLRRLDRGRSLEQLYRRRRDHLSRDRDRLEPSSRGVGGGLPGVWRDHVGRGRHRKPFRRNGPTHVSEIRRVRFLRWRRR